MIGTSLIVQPFSLLPTYTSNGVPRVLLNNEPVDNFERPNDVFIQGDCDESVWKLCVRLGWHDELRELHKKIGGVPREWDTSFSTQKEGDETEGRGEETAVEDTIAQLTKELKEELRLDKEEDVEVRKVESEENNKDENDKDLRSDTWNDNTVVVEKNDTATAEHEESPKDVKEKL